MTGIFFTVTVSPTLISREGFTKAPLINTRFVRHASAASLRVLKIRTAHSHLSTLTEKSSPIVLSYLLLNAFIVRSSPAVANDRMTSPAISSRSGRASASSFVQVPRT